MRRRGFAGTWWAALLVIAACGAARADSVVGVPPVSVAGPGADLTVPIDVRPADGVISMDFVLRYDAAVLVATAVHRTDYTNAFSLASNLAIPGEVHVSLYAASPLVGGGEVAWITFSAIGAAGSSSELAWVQHELNEGLIPSTATGGRVDVAAAQAVISMPDDANGAPGMHVDVPVLATPGDGMLGLDFVVRFNPLVLEAQTVATTPLTSGCTVLPNLSEPGVVRVALYGPEPIAGSGPVLSIGFLVTGGIGSRTPLDIVEGTANEGAISTTLDDGLFTVCADADGDGFTACGGDCDDLRADAHPGAPETCNAADDDCDGSVDEDALPPSGRPTMTGARAGDAIELSWDAVGDAAAYDVVSGRAGTLLASTGDFGSATERCVANELADTHVLDAPLPGANEAFWYLVRAVNCGGGGSYDETAPGQARGRDAGIAASPAACP